VIQLERSQALTGEDWYVLGVGADG